MSLFRKLVGIFQAAGVALRKRLLGSAVVVYVEDVFSTYLYTGNDVALTVTNGIDLSTNGGLVWGKSRSGSQNHRLYDTARGSNFSLLSNATSAQSNQGTNACAFNTDGFSLSAASGIVGSATYGGPNYVSWTFRKQPKFFDIVTYTGNGVASRNISHSLGSKPGFVVIKRTDTTSDWWVAAWTGTTFRIGTDAAPFALNSTNAYNTQNGAAATSTTFDPNEVTLSASYGVTPSAANTNGGTYVAYLFAHDAGGFGLTGTDNVISCGSYTGAGANLNINLGYEPQWVMIKSTTNAVNWVMFDTMRGLPTSGDGKDLRSNLTDSEGDNSALSITSTGFLARTGIDGQVNANGYSYIYIAIRRGPMKVPTSGTSVFTPVRYTTSPEGFITNFPVDFAIAGNSASADKWYWQSRLHGAFLVSSASTDAQVGSGSAKFDMMNGYGTGFSTAYYSNAFRRAPSFMDVVFYTGDGFANNVPHNLSVRPTLLIVKARSATSDWYVCAERDSTTYYQGLGLNSTVAAHNEFPDTGQFTATTFNNSQFRRPAGSALPVGPSVAGVTYVAYLFATLAGVSKVGTYTGTGTTLQINCGFTAGARFVLIKRTDSTGDWYVWDTARGIISGNDPYLLLNSTAAEVTNTDYIDPLSTGFEISSTAPAAINANGGIYIFLAIA
jgi:hypothetical protein